MATYIRLTDYKDSDSKEQGFFKCENRYEAKQSDFEKIPGSPIAYWVSDRVKEIFNRPSLSDENQFSNGLNTGDNEKFLRYWTEVDKSQIKLNSINFEEANLSKKKWFPYNKGGSFQKWYGNDEYIINWANDGYEIKEYAIERNNGSHWSRYLCGMNYQFKKSITWSFVSSSNFGIRFKNNGYLFDVGGSSMFVNNENKYKYYGAFLNTKIAFFMLKNINPTLNFQTGNIGKIPLIDIDDNRQETIDTLTQECIEISKEDWDSRETSWDFSKNELLKHKSDSKIETAYNNYCSYWKEKFYKLHSNEEELNRLFIDIYELQDELTPDVDLKDITILKSESIINDRGELEFKADEIMKQFISYSVGVMFGRYSLDSDGLVVSNLGSETLVSQMTDETKVSFPIDDDNVIPVLEDDYFSDDIASRVINFVKTTFGSQNLSENINFIEKCLGKTIRAYMVKDFYEDHIKRYKKRPIYWMVSSPKKGFMSLSYMHRYQSDIFARVQNNYLREYITKLEGTKDILKQIILDESASSKDKKDADKKIKDIENKLKELISFDRDVLTSFAQNRVDIDLDDGVKVNYNKFKEILYPIKGLDKE
ncbi:BREX-1 system adenine-specific DNA-methyltransferase PglX [Aliarcobacter cryaerophilus]|uniref:BREX-1 system adenine-specific DNA-methyltransferase PglX n=1 Tax=Aliarcobacter cryaerophilus TaxID=28198 RepID=UPI0021B67FE7|nr:BREX-1 system adenine-specific DNA-methyltransferase PglX [Aliarcobacter cryaerophilus]MCT7518897.1 BREX-1 system adenine-specific DNA-methyltransferase PglX [Aliarcobacter cryaerophilus]